MQNVTFHAAGLPSMIRKAADLLAERKKEKKRYVRSLVSICTFP